MARFAPMSLIKSEAWLSSRDYDDFVRICIECGHIQGDIPNEREYQDYFRSMDREAAEHGAFDGQEGDY